jgi:methylenetetrahydrofolate dehydrogenase (NADP+)/methenyltetrahydrofolate cyclohydrolase
MTVDTDLPVIEDGILHGRRVADRVRRPIREQVAALAGEGVVLTLAVVRVGDDPASGVYVRGKIRACEEMGIVSQSHHLPATTTQEELLRLVAALNDNDEVDGILVQLPLPPHISEKRVTESVDPRKDVDGFHPLNLGLLFSGDALLRPCTPAGCMLLLDAAGISPRGRQAVVVGRSVIVGRPVGQMLLRADATVTLCHRHTDGLETAVRCADIVVVAAGVPGLIRGSWIKPGAVVLDVGINRTPEGRVIGDVEFDAARERAFAITPVPGGVGPMTITMLLWNTLLAGLVRRRLRLPRPPLHALRGDIDAGVLG